VADDSHIESATGASNMTKTQQMSALIIAAMQANGGDIRAAFDSVMGEGAYLKLAGELYEQLQG
jgi:hypothetical protein